MNPFIPQQKAIGHEILPVNLASDIRGRVICLDSLRRSLKFLRQARSDRGCVADQPQQLTPDREQPNPPSAAGCECLSANASLSRFHNECRGPAAAASLPIIIRLLRGVRSVHKGLFGRRILIDTAVVIPNSEGAMRAWIFLLLLSLSTTISSAQPAPGPDGFIAMFNGKDLTGWEGKPGWWSVEDGTITSESTPAKPCETAHYLMWRGGKPANFDLQLEFKLVGGNSGIQFRSRELPEYDTSGYQADIEDGTQWTGCLFEHTRGGVAMRGEKVLIARDGTKTVTPLGDPEKLLQEVRRHDWNTYRILARGSEIRLEINGVLMTQVTDLQEGSAARDGVIALQMHPGPPMKIQFRKLRIKLLP